MVRTMSSLGANQGRIANIGLGIVAAQAERERHVDLARLGAEIPHCGSGLGGDPERDQRPAEDPQRGGAALCPDGVGSHRDRCATPTR